MIQHVEDISILVPEGELDPSEGRWFLERIKSLLQYEWGKIVLDLSSVRHVHYRFFLDLLAASLASQLVSGGIKLVNLNSDTEELLKIVGLEKHFETYDSVAEAILSFKNPLTKSCPMQ